MEAPHVPDWMVKYRQNTPVRVWLAVLLVIVLIFGWYLFFFRAPLPFPSGVIVTVSPGESLLTVASDLKKDGVIRSSFWFTNFVVLASRTKGAIEGDYYFPSSENVYMVASRIAHGVYGLAPIAVTIPEGSNLREAASDIKTRIPRFGADEFLKETDGMEGYLFPDTYLFMPNVTVKQVISTMQDNFQQKINEIQQTISVFGKSENDVVVMASILEGEARQTETRRIISGILWKRIREGIPLQVDAPFKYILGKGSADLTKADLKIDSPFNTYIHKGLPPSPISNPGLDALISAVTPIETPYYYFLTDSDGVMHYATTYAQHLANRKKYLGN